MSAHRETPTLECVCMRAYMHACVYSCTLSLSRVLVAPLIAVASAGIYEHYRVGKIVALK